MMTNLEILRTPEGKVFARRKDGRPLTPGDRAAAREQAKLEATKEFPGRTNDRMIACDTEAGKIVAIEICSSVLRANVWLAFDPSFNAADGQAVFYASELPALRNKTPEQLIAIFQAKRASGGGMVRQ